MSIAIVKGDKKSTLIRILSRLLMMKEALNQVMNAGYVVDCMLKETIKQEIMVMWPASIEVLSIKTVILILSWIKNSCNIL